VGVLGADGGRVVHVGNLAARYYVGVGNTCSSGLFCMAFDIALITADTAFDAR
jgi:hypothetical protein